MFGESSCSVFDVLLVLDLNISQRLRGYFCVTDEISGHWARTLGEQKVWETHGSVSHLHLGEFEPRLSSTTLGCRGQVIKGCGLKGEL